MAVYTDITDAELEGFLAGYDIGEALAFKGIAEGVENSNFLLETSRGRFFLTVYERRVKADDLPFFLGLMLWLAEHGFPSARPIADREGRLLGSLRGKPAAIAEFLQGLSVQAAGFRALPRGGRRYWPGCIRPAWASRIIARTISA